MRRIGPGAAALLLGIAMAAAAEGDDGPGPLADREPGKPIPVLVVAEADGRPIAGATVRVDPGQGGAKSTATTDARGRATLPGPAGRRYDVAVSAWADGLRVAGSKHTNKAPRPRPIPADGTPIRLALAGGAMTVGGSVVDDEGRPIAGAEVAVVDADAVVGDDSAPSEMIAMTDDRGRWSSSSVAADSRRLYIGAGHPHFTDPTGVREVDPAQARARASVTTLARGVPVGGRVIDRDGRPIAGATIVKTAEEGASGYDRAESGPDGAFAFRSAFEPGQTRHLIASAPGHAPELFEVTADGDSVRIEARLGPGSTIRGRLVDPRGRPVADASVLVEEWRERACSRVVAVSDKDGRFAWDGAPDDEVAIRVRRAGFQEFATRPVLAREENNDWTLTPALEVELVVADAATGRPIRNFELTREQVDPGTKAVLWENANWGASATPGRSIATVAVGPGRLRLVAQGYRMAETRDLATDEGSIRIDLKLTPLEFGEGGGPSGVVVDAEGRPAAGAEVALAFAGEGGAFNPVLVPNRPEMVYLPRSGSVVADDRGRFTFHPVAGRYLVLAWDRARGYGEVDMEGFRAGAGRVALGPWGRVSGRVEVAGKPVPWARVAIVSDAPTLEVLGQVTLGDETRTDAEGRYAFERVPAGMVRVLVEERDEDEPASEAFRDVRPGQAIDVPLGDAARRPGRTLVGRVSVPEGIIRPVPLGRPDSLTIQSDRDEDPAPKGLKPEERERWLLAWWPTEAGRAFRLGQIQKNVEIGPDGSFRVEGIPPGLYMIQGQYSETVPGQRNAARLAATLAHPFGVPAGPDFAPFDVGAIAVEIQEPENAVDPGDAAPLIEAHRLAGDGPPIRLADFRGRFLLVEFWATWSAPCLAEAPALKAAHDRFGGPKGRLALLSLNLDDDPEAARRFLEGRDRPWTQASLGPPAQDRATRSFGVQSLPSIWLIDPAGEVVAKDLRGDAIAAAVARALGLP